MNTQNGFEMNNNSQNQFNHDDPRWERPRRSGCWSDGLKVGCGFILGVIATIIVIFVVGFSNQKAKDSMVTIEKGYDSTVNEVTKKIHQRKLNLQEITRHLSYQQIKE